MCRWHWLAWPHRCLVASLVMRVEWGSWGLQAGDPCEAVWGLRPGWPRVLRVRHIGAGVGDRGLPVTAPPGPCAAVGVGEDGSPAVAVRLEAPQVGGCPRGAGAVHRARRGPGQHPLRLLRGARGEEGAGGGAVMGRGEGRGGRSHLLGRAAGGLRVSWEIRPRDEAAHPPQRGAGV